VFENADFGDECFPAGGGTGEDQVFPIDGPCTNRFFLRRVEFVIAFLFKKFDKLRTNR
jgi:hypothetical protein